MHALCACVPLSSGHLVVSDSLRPHGLWPTRLLCPWDCPGKNTGVGCHASSRGSFNPGIKPRFLALQADSLPSEPLGKPKNTRVGSLSLPQGIFQAQEWNRGLLHCRWILHQLTYQGSPELGADMFFLIRVSPAK